MESTKETMLEKLQKAAPYNIFFNKIPKSSNSLGQPNTINFKDLLCPSLGQLKCSLQLTFVISVEWLIEQYKMHNLEQKPLTLIYGWDVSKETEDYMDTSFPNLTYHFVDMEVGCHHSKIGLYVYEDNSLRVVISSANLYQNEWDHANNMFWVSPPCPQLPENTTDTGESLTGFKSSLIHYIQFYNLLIMKPWLDRIKTTDFSAVKVFLVTSVPGVHYPAAPGSHLREVGDILMHHCTLPDDSLSWPIIAQVSSVGFFGKSPTDWLRTTILRSLASHDRAPMAYISSAIFKLIYPSIQDVTGGLLSLKSGFCLNYLDNVHKQQRWLKGYMYHWKADKLNRSQTMPHCKTYCRISPCLTKLGWFLLTSANMSRAAWGGNVARDKGLRMKNFEAGVMFIPKFFEEEFFEIVVDKNEKEFPFVYDLPLTEYSSKEAPWTVVH